MNVACFLLLLLKHSKEHGRYYAQPNTQLKRSYHPRIPGTHSTEEEKTFWKPTRAILSFVVHDAVLMVDPTIWFTSTIQFFFILQPPFLGMFNFRFFFHIYISVLNPPFLGVFEFSFFFNIHMSVLKPPFLGVFKFRFFFNNNIFVLNLLFLGVFQALL